MLGLQLYGEHLESDEISSIGKASNDGNQTKVSDDETHGQHIGWNNGSGAGSFPAVATAPEPAEIDESMLPSSLAAAPGGQGNFSVPPSSSCDCCSVMSSFQALNDEEAKERKEIHSAWEGIPLKTCTRIVSGAITNIGGKAANQRRTKHQILARLSVSLSQNDEDTCGFECECVFVCAHVCALIDSGASGSVLPLSECPDVLVEENQKSRTGYAYEVAGGHRIVNKGEKEITLVPQEGHLGLMKFQVATVNKALVSVSELGGSGHNVVFERKGAYVRGLIRSP